MNDDPVYDYGEDSTPAIGQNLMAMLIGAADQQEKLEAEIADLEAQVETKKAMLKDVSERTIPGMLDGLRGKVLLDDGRSLEVTDKIRASIAGEKAPPAIKWVEEHGSGNIVKNEVTVLFNKDEEDLARELMETLKLIGLQQKATIKKSIHHMTLEAWVREQLANGEDLPKDIFGIFRQRMTKISR